MDINLDVNLDVTETIYELSTQFELGEITADEFLTLGKKLEVIAKSIKNNEAATEQLMVDIKRGTISEKNGVKYGVRKRNSYDYDFDLYKELDKKIKDLRVASKQLLDNGVESIGITYDGKNWDIEKPIVEESEVLFITLPKN